jgi:hypothetical protein
MTYTGSGAPTYSPLRYRLELGALLQSVIVVPRGCVVFVCDFATVLLDLHIIIYTPVSDVLHPTPLDSNRDHV